MTSIRLAKNADFSQSGLGMLMPVSDMQVFSYFGKNLDESTKNYAPGGDELRGTTFNGGTFTFTDSSITTQSVSPRAALDTDVAESASMSLFVVGMPNGNFSSTFGSPYLVGNLTRQPSLNSLMTGLGLRLSPSSAIIAELGDGENETVKSLSLDADMTVPQFYALTLSDGVITLYNKTDGLTISDIDDRANKDFATQNMRFGSSGNASMRQGASRLFFGAVADRGYSFDEVDAVYRQVRRALKSRGIEV